MKALAKCYFVPQDGQVQVMLFDAVASNGKHFSIGKGLGRFEKNEGMVLSDIASIVLERLCKHSHADESQVWLLEIRDRRRVWWRLKQTFDLAPDGAAIMVICATSEIYDATVPFLKIEPPLGLTPSSS